MPMIATTIISSIKVKPFWRDLMCAFGLPSLESEAPRWRRYFQHLLPRTSRAMHEAFRTMNQISYLSCGRLTPD
jgi:hypothetical protein